MIFSAMASENSEGLILSLIFILLVLHTASSNGYEGNGMNGSEEYVSLHYEVNEEVSTSLFEVNERESTIGGRKMLSKGSSAREVEKQANVKPPTIQDKYKNDNVFHKSSHKTDEKDDSRAFFEATDEMENLMNKDYKGAARRKPPIHNREPTN